MRLLLAEDELALSKALTAILERNNYSVDAAYDGQEALELIDFIEPINREIQRQEDMSSDFPSLLLLLQHIEVKSVQLRRTKNPCKL